MVKASAGAKQPASRAPLWPEALEAPIEAWRKGLQPTRLRAGGWCVGRAGCRPCSSGRAGRAAMVWNGQAWGVLARAREWSQEFGGGCCGVIRSPLPHGAAPGVSPEAGR